MKKAGYLSAIFALGYPARNSIKFGDGEGSLSLNWFYRGSSLSRQAVASMDAIKFVFSNYKEYVHFS